MRGPAEGCFFFLCLMVHFHVSADACLVCLCVDLVTIQNLTSMCTAPNAERKDLPSTTRLWQWVPLRERAQPWHLGSNVVGDDVAEQVGSQIEPGQLQCHDGGAAPPSNFPRTNRFGRLHALIDALFALPLLTRKNIWRYGD